MRLDSVTLHNYLSHLDSTLVLDGMRLVVLVGPNGGGKSALLEPLKYVLFDDGRAKTDQLVRLGQTDMSASIEFTFAGSRYRAVRGRTTKGAGRTYLEVAVQGPDGAWISQTRDDIRSTQAFIEELLGVDADTFGTAVFLGQGEANRFAEATAGERKRILGQVLGLEIYAKAETQARDEARTLEATTSMDRLTVERIDDAIGELGDCIELAQVRRNEIHELAQIQTAAAADRNRIQARLTELAAEIAKGDAAAAELARLEEERAGLAERYRREKAAIQTADLAIVTAGTSLQTAPDVEAAIADLPGARAEVASLEAAEVAWRSLVDQVRQQRDKVMGLEREWERLWEPWNLRIQAARVKATTLEERGKAGTSVCESCGQTIGREQALEQLAAARAEVESLEATEPKQPLAIARESATHERLDSRLREATEPEPLVLRVARDQLAKVERSAARAEAIEAARTALATARMTKAEAEAELAKITEAGETLAGRIAEAKAKTEGTAALVAEQERLRSEGGVITTRIDALQRGRVDLERALAQAETNVARLEQLQGERAEVWTRLEVADVDLGRLRRLVAAFGVTGIPARIIEGVLPELSGYANELLGELRPGMVLEIRAQREKKSGKGVVEALDLIVRDDVGERPLSVFSGGERMSVSLAIATALSRLVARRAGTAIRTLVIDEPDGLDADARRSFGQALRVLAHHGELERVVLVSHHPDLAEFGDAVYQVTKSGAGSVVEQVA